MDTCRELDLPCYRILATPVNKDHLTKPSQVSFLNDDATSKIFLIFDFYIGIPKLEHLKVFANRILSFILEVVEEPGTTFASTSVEGVTLRKFMKCPRLLWVKVRNCSKVLVPNCPPGYVAIPPLSKSVAIKMPEGGIWSPTLLQYPAIPAMACTPEMLQGTTLEYWITISMLD
ncbi:hypothetical protein HDU80_003394 [Chytriomyces hyalinus]|nr:hypothetical protein HDU80_003394 [Chytriomyces hyalinus]